MRSASWTSRLCRRLIRGFAVLVPRAERQEWLREWDAELVHRERALSHPVPMRSGTSLDLLGRTIGAVVDAYHLRKLDWNRDMIGQDIRYAVRTIVRAPIFSSVVVVTLALGIGANTAVFSVVNSVLFEPLDLPEPDGLVMVWESNIERGWPRFTVSPANYVDWRDRNEAFESIAAMSQSTLTLTGEGDPVRLRSASVDPAFFEVLRSRPALGRPFGPRDAEPGAASVVVISHALWLRLFGGDSTVVGRNVRVDGQTWQIIGVMPPGFGFPQIRQADPIELWYPLVFDFDVSGARGAHYLSVVARLGSGVNVAEGQQAMELLSASLAQTYPRTNEGWSAVVVPMLDQILGSTIRQTLLVIWAAVALVLIITGVNIASLMLSRSTARQQEFAVRAALGAGRARLIRQIMVESLLLTGVGAAAGVALAALGLQQLVALDPGNIPRLQEVGVTGIALAYTSLVALIVGLGSGLVPVFHSVRHSTFGKLTSARGRTATRGHERLRQILVISEIAMALVVVIASGLLTRTLRELQSVDLGFRYDDVMLATLSLPQSEYDTPDRVNAFYRTVLERIRQAPGVIAAGAGSPAPLAGDFRFSYEIVGDNSVDLQRTSALFRRVAGDYFDVLSIPVLQGRTFDDRDTHEAAPVIVINQEFARRHFANSDPIGRFMNVGTSSMPCPCEIIGVVGTVRQYGPSTDPDVGVYVAQEQLNGFRSLTLVVRTANAHGSAAPLIRQAVAEADPNLAISELTPYRDRVAQALARPRFNTIALSTFAMIALLLALVGIYGVMAYTVSQRTREIGIRIALGSAPRQVYRMLLARALRLTMVGTVIGLVGAAISTRFLGDLLFAVAPLDPVTFVAVPVSLVAVGALAGLVPARRAATVDPAVALREE